MTSKTKNDDHTWRINLAPVKEAYPSDLEYKAYSPAGKEELLDVSMNAGLVEYAKYEWPMRHPASRSQLRVRMRQSP